jgi:hypothetical protein
MTDSIRDTIDRFEPGYVFATSEFEATAKNPTAVSRILSQFVAEGYLRKLSKGRFYKPKISELGELPPDTYQIVKDLLVEDCELIGYITGYSAFNDLMLTTQVPAVLQIGMRREKKAIIRGIYRIHFIKQENTITQENVPLLRLLDCLRFFKIIPDTTPDQACLRLLFLLKELDQPQVAWIKQLALNYSPQTITLLGAMLETLNPGEDTSALFKKLNPMTTYTLSVSNSVLPTQKKWNIR